MPPADYLPRRVRPPVLLYHRVAPIDAREDPLCVTPEQFEAHMRYLAESGFTTHGLHAAVHGRRPVVVTFDDGYLDTYATAFPILERHGLTATVFVVTAHLGSTSGAWGPPAPAPLMSWAQAAELARHGISFQSHTRTHPDLTRCSDAVALAELVDSRAELEDRLGVAVDALAYPFGNHDARVIALAGQAGYRSGWAAGLAATPGPFARERFQIAARDTLSSLAVKASGWGAWLRKARGAARQLGAARGVPPARDQDWVGPRPC